MRGAGRGRPRHHQAFSPVRGVVLAVAATLIALTAHVVASGGGNPHVTTALPVALLVGGVATRLADRCRSVVAVISLLGAAQFAIHVLLTVSAHDHHHAGAEALSDTAAMLAAHATAVLVTALLLAHADTLLSRLRAALLAFLPHVVATPVPADSSVAVLPRWSAAAPAHTVRLVYASPRRGPPLMH